MRRRAWIADYPDGDNFMQLLYGNEHRPEQQRLLPIPEYDKLYEQVARAAATGPSATGSTAR